MSVRIQPVVDNESYSVNGKLIYKDSNGNYVAQVELTTQEANAFNNYKKSIIDNPALKKHTRATFGKR